MSSAYFDVHCWSHTGMVVLVNHGHADTEPIVTRMRVLDDAPDGHVDAIAEALATSGSVHGVPVTVVAHLHDGSTRSHRVGGVLA
jgi:hypothetical protein